MGHEPNRNEIQSQGRESNAALPLDVEGDNAGAERYPPARKDDGLERLDPQARSFEHGRNPAPRQGAGDGGPAPGGAGGSPDPNRDPVEGKR